MYWNFDLNNAACESSAGGAYPGTFCVILYLLFPWKGTSLLKTVSTNKKYNYIYGVYKKGGFPGKTPNAEKK